MPGNPATTSPRRKRRAALVATGLLVLGSSLLGGCSGYFPLWLKAPGVDPAAPHFAGAWTGHWEYGRGKHGGPVQALVPAVPSADGSYPVKFRAGWAGVVYGRYTVPTRIEIESVGTARSLSEKDLGSDQGGTYSLKATITPGRFRGVFRSRAGEIGAVEMRRPEP